MLGNMNVSILELLSLNVGEVINPNAERSRLATLEENIYLVAQERFLSRVNSLFREEAKTLAHAREIPINSLIFIQHSSIYVLRNDNRYLLCDLSHKKAAEKAEFLMGNYQTIISKAETILHTEIDLLRTSTAVIDTVAEKLFEDEFKRESVHTDLFSPKIELKISTVISVDYFLFLKVSKNSPIMKSNVRKNELMDIKSTERIIYELMDRSYKKFYEELN